jgi:hypothetical protein
MKRLYLFAFFLLIICNTACVQTKFKEPQNKNSNDLEFATAKSIAELRASMGVAGAKLITENIVINGQVIANDRTGNFYKQIIIDDGTAAIPILLDAYNLYSNYPIGTKLYVKCKGLYTNFYYKLPQLSFLPDSRGVSTPIPFHLWSQYLLKSTNLGSIKPIEVSIVDAMKVKPELLNRLVAVVDVQIQDTLVKEFALHPDLSSATNIKLMDCDSNTIALRTSGYSNFRNVRPRTGRGKITAIYTVFNNTPQLVLRDTSDFEMDQPRCF